MAMAAAPSRIKLGPIDMPPKSFCSKEDRAKERTASEAASSDVADTGSSLWAHSLLPLWIEQLLCAPHLGAPGL